MAQFFLKNFSIFYLEYFRPKIFGPNFRFFSPVDLGYFFARILRAQNGKCTFLAMLLKNRADMLHRTLKIAHFLGSKMSDFRHFQPIVIGKWAHCLIANRRFLKNKATDIGHFRPDKPKERAFLTG